jgi:hypothetical protein
MRKLRRAKKGPLKSTEPVHDAHRNPKTTVPLRPRQKHSPPRTRHIRRTRGSQPVPEARRGTVYYLIRTSLRSIQFVSLSAGSLWVQVRHHSLIADSQAPTSSLSIRYRRAAGNFVRRYSRRRSSSGLLRSCSPPFVERLKTPSFSSCTRKKRHTRAGGVTSAGSL